MALLESKTKNLAVEGSPTMLCCMSQLEMQLVMAASPLEVKLHCVRQPNINSLVD